MRPRTVFVTLLGVLAIAASCNSGAQHRTVRSSEVLSHFAADTMPATTSRYSVVTSVAQNEGEFVTFSRMRGIYDFERGEASVEMRIEVPVKGYWDRPFTWRWVYDQTGIYMSLPKELGLDPPPGKTWVKAGTEDLQKLTSGTFDFSALLRGNPAQDVRFLLRRADRIEDLGTEEVRGAKAHRYRMNVHLEDLVNDLRKLRTRVGGTAGRFYERLIKQLGGGNPLLTDVWIDEGGRIRRQMDTVETTVSTDDGPVDVKYRQVYEYFDYGTPLSVRPPPASKTADAKELEKR
jgi:hypothetical protein